MTRQEIIKRVNDIVINVVVGEEERNIIKEDASLKSDLGADSLDVFEIAMEVEKEFVIDISYEESEMLLTVCDIYDIVERKLNEKTKV